VPEGTSTGFDPADPPPGFGLCHNGHCHADGGSLVAYEDVAIAASESVASGRVIQPVDAGVELVRGSVSVPFEGPCEGCQLDPGQLGSVGLNIVAVRVRGQVFDLLEGDARRLPEAGVEVSFTVLVDVALGRQLGGVVGKDDPPGVEIQTTFLMTERLFDGVDWSVPQSEEDLAASVTEALEESAFLDVRVSRFDLEN
jgi:hypothetical protein